MLAGGGQKHKCAKCGLHPIKDGFEDYDGCLGKLKGDVMNACCGHGDDNLAYIQKHDGSCVRGADAIEIQNILKGGL